jgi:hypothetical protein
MRFDNTKWDQSKWTDSMKAQWQENMFSSGYSWFYEEEKPVKNYVFVYNDKDLSSGNKVSFEIHPFEVRIWEDMFPTETVKGDQEEKPKGNPKYDRVIYGKYDTGTCVVDVYDVLDAFEVTNPQLQHACKKILAAGKRGHKDLREDLVDILHSVQSALDSFDKKVS